MTTAEQVRRESPTVVKPGDEDLQFWSVTTLLQVLDKPALLYWAAEQSGKAAVAVRHSLAQRVEEEGEEAVVKWLRDARFRRPSDELASTALGTVFHSCAEEYALTGIRPTREQIVQRVFDEAGSAKFAGADAEADVIETMLDRFDGWLQRFSPSFQATEVTVYSPRYGYAGTCDGFLTIDGTRFIIDYKTSREPYDSKGKPKTPYPEQVGLQLAAYRYAELAAVWRPRVHERFRRRYYLLGQTEQEMAQPVPEVDSGLVIHVTPEACEAFPINCDRRAHKAFLHVIEAFRWVNETSKQVMGDPLT